MISPRVLYKQTKINKINKGPGGDVVGTVSNPSGQAGSLRFDFSWAGLGWVWVRYDKTKRHKEKTRKNKKKGGKGKRVYVKKIWDLN